jgi:hypothetical protein
MPECEASYRGASMCQFECLDGLSDETTKFFSDAGFSLRISNLKAGSHWCGDGALIPQTWLARFS